MAYYVPGTAIVYQHSRVGKLSGCQQLFLNSLAPLSLVKNNELVYVILLGAAGYSASFVLLCPVGTL